MSYFSRLTDIVTCNLTEILARESDPQAAIESIVKEKEEGLAGAKPSVSTANESVARLNREIGEHQTQADGWMDQAKAELQKGNEAGARTALMRKQEIEDVVAGLEQQHAAAIATRDHLQTMLRALEARMTEARRKLRQLEQGLAEETPTANVAADAHFDFPEPDGSRADQVEAELKALKKLISGGE
jgi:phage shock protein A